MGDSENVPCAQVPYSCLRHTYTHAAPAVGVWLHGEAVAAGIIMAADMSHRLGWIDQDLLDRTRRLMQRAKLPIEPPQVRQMQSCLINTRALLHKSVTIV